MRAHFSEKDKDDLKAKHLEILKLVLPIYRDAAARGLSKPESRCGSR